MNKRENNSIIATVLKSLFGPIVKLSAKWPPILAYGVPCIIAALLIAILRPNLPNNLFWLILVLILAPLVGYLASDWNMRREQTEDVNSRTETKQYITGNVFFQDNFPVADAIITVDGLDGQALSDGNGWFQIAVNQQNQWIVRARYEDQITQSTIRINDLQGSIRLKLKTKQISEKQLAEHSPKLDTNLLALLDLEKDQCRQRNTAFLTPNFLLSLITVRTSLARRVFDQACPNKAQSIIDGLQRFKPVEDGALLPFTEFSWYDRKDVQAARRRAAQEGKPIMDARHLLLGFLDTESATRTELERALGADDFDRLRRVAESAGPPSETPGVTGLFTTSKPPSNNQ